MTDPLDNSNLAINAQTSKQFAGLRRPVLVAEVFRAGVESDDDRTIPLALPSTPMSAPQFDVVASHRWIAIEFNNMAWELVELDRRTDDEVQEMIRAAHAAAIHWAAAGMAANSQRAEVLLATAYIKANHATPAMHHARHGLSLSEQHSSAVTLFDRAMALAACPYLV